MLYPLSHQLSTPPSQSFTFHKSPIDAPLSSQLLSVQSPTTIVSRSLKSTVRGSPSFYSSVASTPRSPLTLRLFKQINGFNDNNNEDGPGSGLGCSVSGSDSPYWTLLKRKRPAKLEIPIAPPSSAVNTPAGVERLVEVVDEGEGYYVYCKRGKKSTMEDRYSAFVDLHGDSKQGIELERHMLSWQIVT